MNNTLSKLADKYSEDTVSRRENITDATQTEFEKNMPMESIGYESSNGCHGYDVHSSDNCSKSSSKAPQPKNMPGNADIPGHGGIDDNWEAPHGLNPPIISDGSIGMPPETWKDSIPVVALSTYIAANKRHGFYLHQKDGCPVVHISPGVSPMDPDRWEIARVIVRMVEIAFDDLVYLMDSGALNLPPAREYGLRWVKSPYDQAI